MWLHRVRTCTCMVKADVAVDNSSRLRMIERSFARWRRTSSTSSPISTPKLFVLPISPQDELTCERQCMITKALIKESLPSPDSANVREVRRHCAASDVELTMQVFAGVERFVTGKPQIQFARLAAKTKRHKL